MELGDIKSMVEGVFQEGGRSRFETTGRSAAEIPPIVVERIEHSAVWITVELSVTVICGTCIEAFVTDLGSGEWLQGWSDGETLTIAATEVGLPRAVEVVRSLLAVAGQSRT